MEKGVANDQTNLCQIIFEFLKISDNLYSFVNINLTDDPKSFLSLFSLSLH